MTLIFRNYGYCLTRRNKLETSCNPIGLLFITSYKAWSNWDKGYWELNNMPMTPPVTAVTSSNETDYLTNSEKMSLQLSIDSTLKRGTLLGVMKPVWLKTTESEERIRWLRQMIGKNLLVRDLEAFLKSTSKQLRSDEIKIREEEREVVMKLMIVKRNDERRKLRELQREKESLRRIIHKKYGRKKMAFSL